MTFLPDPEIFQITTRFPQVDIAERLEELAVFSPGLEINLIDQREKSPGWDPRNLPERERFCYPAGVQDFVKKRCEGEQCLLPEPLVIRETYPVRINSISRGETSAPMRLEVALQFTDKLWSEEISSYCNAASTTEGGTHLDGFRFALLQCLRELGKKADTSEEPVISRADCLGGVVAVIAIEHMHVNYSGSIKNCVCTPRIEGIVYEIVSRHLRRFLEQNPLIAKTLAQRIVTHAGTHVPKVR